MSPNDFSGNWRTLRKWLWLLPIFIVYFLINAVVRKYGVNQPFSDEFDTPGLLIFNLSQHHFHWADFWSWHTDSRMVFPKIGWAIQALVWGWSPKFWMYFGVLICLVEAIILCLLSKLDQFDWKIRWLPAAAFALLLLHPNNADGTFLRAIQYIVIVPSLALLTGLYLEPKWVTLRGKFFSYVAWSVLATLTFANGMALWVFLFPWRTALQVWQVQDRRQRKAFVFWAICSTGSGLLLLIAYMIGYHPIRVPLPPDHVHPPEATFYLRWLGASIADRFDVRWAFSVGSTLTIATLWPLGWLVARSFRERSLRLLVDAWPWLILIGYAALSGMASAHGRVDLPGDNALVSRYFLVSLQYWAGLLGLVICLLEDSSFSEPARSAMRRRIWLAIPMIALVVYSILTWEAGVESAHRAFIRSQRYKLALRLWKEVPQIAPIAYPHPELVRSRYLALVETGFLRAQPEKPWLMNALQEAAHFHPIGKVRLSGQGEDLRVSGHLSKAFPKCPNPAILTALRLPDGNLSPVSVDIMVPQSSKTSHPRLQISTKPFLRNVIPCPDPNDLVFFALDPIGKKAYLLNSFIKKN